MSLSLPTVPVTIDVTAMTGVPCAGAHVSIKADKDDAWTGGLVVAKKYTGTADSSGIVVASLFPNNPTTGLGIKGSIYTFKIQPIGGDTIEVTAQVPNVACSLQDIMDLDTVPSLTAAQAAQSIAQAAAAAAATSADEAEAAASTAAATTAASLLATALMDWALSQSFRLVAATRNSDGVITTASIVWPDGATGTFTTDTLSTAFPGAIDAWHATYVGATTKTVTQTAVTRDGTTGAVTVQPAITIA